MFKNKIIKNILHSLFVLLTYFFLSFSISYAANLTIVADKNKVDLNEIFTVTVFVNTQGIAINNSEGDISFPVNLLQVQSVTTSDSIFNIWVEQPSFSNTAGTISYNGGIPTPGYTGTNGRVFRVTFKALNSGNAPIAFSSASVLSNDGSGTDVTNNLSNTSVTIGQKTEEVKPDPEPVATLPITKNNTLTSSLPTTPIVTSREIPSQTEWYSVDTAIFKWNLSNDVLSVQTSIDSKPEGIPSKTFTPAISSRTAILLDDGTAYFHVRFKNSIGWGSTGTYKINIDNEPPKDFQVTSELTIEGLTRLTLKANDVTSGMYQYVIYIDGVEIASIEGDNDVAKTRVLPVLNAGKHTAVIRAYDRAKNYIEKTVTFTSPELKTPTIISYPSEIQTGNRISVVGKAYYPNTDVKIYIIEDDDKPVVFDVKSDTDGLFKFESRAVTAKKLVSIQAETNLSDKETKILSDMVFVKVSKSAFEIIMSKITNLTSVIVPFIGMLLLLAFFFYVFYMRLRIKQAKLKSDLRDAETELHAEFTAIQNNINSYVKTLSNTKKKRDLTKEETKLLKEFSKVIARIEKVVDLKIKNIEEKDL